jgi:hypothetical protein
VSVKGLEAYEAVLFGRHLIMSGWKSNVTVLRTGMVRRLVRNRPVAKTSGSDERLCLSTRA